MNNRGFYSANRSQEPSPQPLSISQDSLPIANLALQLAGQTDTRQFLRCAGEWLYDNSNMPLITIYWYDPATNRLVYPMVVGGEIPHLPQHVRMGSGSYGRVAAQRRTDFIESLAHERHFGPTLDGMNSAYLLPLMHEAVLYGVMGLQAESKDAFPQRVRADLDKAIHLISAMLSVTHQLTDSKQVIQSFDRFQLLTQDLTAHLTSDELLQKIVEAAREMLDADISLLLDVDDSGLTLCPKAWAGIDDETAKLIRSRLKEDLKGMVAWARQPARTADLRIDQRTALATQAVVAGMVSELAVPVLYDDQLYGVLAVETREHRHFTDQEMNLLTSLASHVGVAINNAHLFEALAEQNNDLERAMADLVISKQQAENARLAAVQANRLKTEFINNMSHELRTPLNAVINFTRLVTDGYAGPVTEQQVTYLTYVHESGEHLLGLINDILDLAKIEAGKMMLRPEPTELAPMFKGVLSTTIGLTRNKKIALKQDIDEELPMLTIDARRIRQVLLNLLSNAAKFTQQGSITLRAKRDTDKVVISVEDTGIGIAANDIPKVFEEFRQVDNALQETAGGTGLGMPISRRFVQLHGGDMWIESTLGQGTTVFFTLPMNPVYAEANIS